MDKNKKIEIPKKVQKIMEPFLKKGAEIYIVGGAVRDLLLDREVKDWDFTTNLTPDEMKKLFPKNSFYNNKFGTFSIVGEDKEVFEVTTFRIEQGYNDSRHPDEIEWGKSLSQDLERRDFTINAMALKIDLLDKRQDINIIDPYEGEKDLDEGLIKAVGNPDERFGEDALRMMRAVRIGCQLGFVLELKTFESIQRNAKKISKVSGERIRDELFKILSAKKPAEGIMILKNCGLLKEIIPELLEGFGVAQKGHHIDDVWTHSLKTLENCDSKDPVTRLACLLHDLAKPMVMKGEGEERTFHNHEVKGSRVAVNIGKRLKLSNKQLDQLFKLVRWHMFTVSEVQTDKAVRRFIRNVTVEYLIEMISLRRADRLGSGAKETSWRWEDFKSRLDEVQKQAFSIKELKVNGEDVMKILNIKPGRKVGEVLESLFAEVEEDPKLNERDILLEKIKKFV